MRGLASTCLILCSITAGSASAQDAAEPAPGEVRIRVTRAAHTDPTVGTRVSIDAKTLRMVPAGQSDTVAIAMASIRKVEESAGRRSGSGSGALIGGLIGAAAGVAFFALAPGGSEAGEEPGFGPVAIGGGTVLGLLIGTAIGSLSQEDRWVASPAVALDPASGAPELGVAAQIGAGPIR